MLTLPELGQVVKSVRDQSYYAAGGILEAVGRKQRVIERAAVMQALKLRRGF